MDGSRKTGRILPLLLYLAGVTLLAVAFLVLVGPFGEESDGKGPGAQSRDAVTDVPETAPMYRTADFYGINTGPQDILQSSISERPESSDVAGDFIFEARVKITATGSADASAGMFFLGADSDTHYNFGIFPNQDRVKLYDPVGQNFVLNSYRPRAFTLGDWHTLKASVSGGIIRLYVDGTEVTPPQGIATTRSAGYVGLRVKSSDALFDDCRLTDARTGAPVFTDDFSGGDVAWTPDLAEGWSAVKDGGDDVYRGNVLLGAEKLGSSEVSPGFTRRMDLVAQTGASSMRVFFNWSDIQPQGPDSYFWDYMDAVVKAAHDRNMTVLPVLVYVPDWAVAPEHRGDEASFAFPPENMSDFSRFAHAVTRRYMIDGQLARENGWIDGFGIDHFEIGHEYNVSRVYKPNGKLLFVGWQGNLDDFLDLLQAGHDAVKGQCPSCRILNGAAADDMETAYPGRRDISGVRQNLWQGVEDMYEAIGKRNPGDPHAVDRYFDILNIHTYEWFILSAGGQFPDPYRQYAFPDPLWYRDRIGNTLDVMARYGDAGREIWLTETSYPSSWDGDPISGFIGDQGQADAVRMVYAEASVYPQIKRVYWWYSNDINFSVGLIRRDMTTKPSWDAYRELTGKKRPDTGGESLGGPAG